MYFIIIFFVILHYERTRVTNEKRNIQHTARIPIGIDSITSNSLQQVVMSASPLR